MIFILSIGLSSGSASNGASNQPAQWSLSVTCGGAPFEKKFKVELNQTGLLSVIEEDPARLPNDTITKLTAKLPAKDLQEIYQRTLLVFERLGGQEKNEVVDGSWINVELVTGGRTLARGYHVGQTEEEAPEVAKLFALINKHLPKEHHIY